MIPQLITISIRLSFNTFTSAHCRSQKGYEVSFPNFSQVQNHRHTLCRQQTLQKTRPNCWLARWAVRVFTGRAANNTRALSRQPPSSSCCPQATKCSMSLGFFPSYSGRSAAAAVQKPIAFPSGNVCCVFLKLLERLEIKNKTAGYCQIGREVVRPFSYDRWYKIQWENKMAD